MYESSYNFCGPQVYFTFVDVSFSVVPLRQQDVNPHFSVPHPVWQPLLRVQDTAVQTRSGAQSHSTYAALRFSCLLQTAKALPLLDVSLYAGPRVYIFIVLFTPIGHFFFQTRLKSLCTLAQSLGFKEEYCIFLLLE